ncbi:hypothetical protein FQR65_LT05840 [Abscondita terminalis]|nr:hypothetical protein FQR65_LT05840 [Abscondita terminalis]
MMQLDKAASRSLLQVWLNDLIECFVINGGLPLLKFALNFRDCKVVHVQNCD